MFAPSGRPAGRRPLAQAGGNPPPTHTR